MDDSDKKVRRSALRQVAISMALGFLIGLGAGVAIASRYLDRVIVMPLDEGVKV